MHRRWSLPLLLVALLAGAGPLAAQGLSTAALITDVAWAPEGYVGRVLVNLTGPVRYRTVASPSSIVVDLWEARYQSPPSLHMTHPYVSGVRISQITGDLARLHIDLWQPARYKTFVKPHPHQVGVLVIPPSMATSRLPDSASYEEMRVSAGGRTTTARSPPSPTGAASRARSMPA